MNYRFDEELVKQYAKQIRIDSKRKKTSMKVAASTLVYIAAMCGEIAITQEADFYDAIITAAKKYGRVDKRSRHKQHP